LLYSLLKKVKYLLFRLTTLIQWLIQLIKCNTIQVQVAIYRESGVKLATVWAKHIAITLNQS